ncbi:metallophosphoesterase [Viridibacillus sp. YIM B01967]|uniref:Metallophosphoesterase n=1 Tax=Viridibacillus soli TaxID=2798301 RepID=A0ABS1H962_9BACL|nr:metallophosphoesterase [Viridibacillus soli]MBK3495949.1 metallophosphoesterase [Viridibacillus soli]
MSIIRFFHTADLHLDSPFKGMSALPKERLQELRHSTFAAFDRFIQYAVQELPDFIVIVGDIYDGEDRSLRAQAHFQNGMEQLYEKNIPVILSYGNHDHLNGKWTRFELPPNVHVLPKKTEQVTLQIRETAVHVYGFSYSDRHVKEPMINTYPVATNKDAIHIGMLHGSLMGNTTHDVYAPFAKEDLLAKQYDYWALGHIHMRQILNEEPPIVYSGNIQSRHRKERGVKGFYDVTIDNHHANLDFVPTSVIVYDELIVNCEGLVHANEILQACENTVQQFRDQFGAGVIELRLEHLESGAKTLFEDSTIEEWLELIREREEQKSPAIWIQSVHINWQDFQEYEPTVATEAVLHVIDNWDDMQWKETLKDLYQHPRGGRYLEPLSKAELEQISKQTKNLFKNYVSQKD